MIERGDTGRVKKNWQWLTECYNILDWMIWKVVKEITWTRILRMVKELILLTPSLTAWEHLEFKVITLWGASEMLQQAFGGREERWAWGMLRVNKFSRSKSGAVWNKLTINKWEQKSMLLPQSSEAWLAK